MRAKDLGIIAAGVREAGGEGGKAKGIAADEFNATWELLLDAGKTCKSWGREIVPPLNAVEAYARCLVKGSVEVLLVDIEAGVVAGVNVGANEEVVAVEVVVSCREESAPQGCAVVDLPLSQPK